MKISGALSSLILATLVFGGCTTAPRAQAPKETATVAANDPVIRQYETRAEILDRTSGRINTVDIDFVTEGRKNLRLDVVGTFATPVAIVVLKDKELTCLLPRQKRYYRGPVDSAALASVLGLRIEPDLFFSLLFEEVPKSGDWECDQTNGRVNFCRHRKLPQSFKWEDEQGGLRKLTLSDRRFRITMRPNQVPTKVETPERIFSLAIPLGYTGLK